MKRLALLFLMTIFFAANGAGGEQLSGQEGRNLSTPADRLVGHWTNDLEENYYFGKPADGIGSYIIVPPDGKPLPYKYKVVTQDPAGEKIVVLLLFREGEAREETYLIAKDGKQFKKTSIYRGVEVISLRNYVDDREKP